MTAPDTIPLDAKALEALKPCAFCGGKARLLNGGPGNHYVRCDDCAAGSDDGSKERAIAAWNRRAPLSAAVPADVAVERFERTFGDWDGACCKMLPKADGTWIYYEAHETIVASLSADLAHLKAAVAEKDRALEALRNLARDVAWFDWSDNDPDAVAAVAALRNAVKSERDTGRADRARTITGGAS